MRPAPWRHLDQHRRTWGELASEPGAPHGLFEFRLNLGGRTIRCIAADGVTGLWPNDEGYGWEHVSVSVDAKRCPTWEEMDAVRNLFWLPTETVWQYHVPHAEHVNVHPYVLHLWRLVDFTMPRPPKWMVG